MLSEMIPCHNNCDDGKLYTHIIYGKMFGGGHEIKEMECPTCEGKGYIVEPVRQPPGVDFFAAEEEKG